ncbi:MAG: anaerobic ribonucleoside-triphosphate reductase activating protein [Halanaerobiales bacterium]
MKISGIIKTTLIDFPGYIATTLFTQGCNFKCPYCHNPELIKLESGDGKYLDEDFLWEFLQDRREFLDGVVITGGEPTIQTDLKGFLVKVKKLDYRVKLDTNGSRPQILKDLIERDLLDYVAVDVKGSSLNYKKFSDDTNFINKLQESLVILDKTAITVELRTTVVPGLHDEQEMKRIGELLKDYEFDSYTIQNFRPDETYNRDFEKITPFTEKELQEFREIMKKYINKVEIKN